jgi:hypothetical protein
MTDGTKARFRRPIQYNYGVLTYECSKFCIEHDTNPNSKFKRPSGVTACLQLRLAMYKILIGGACECEGESTSARAEVRSDGTLTTKIKTIATIVAHD